MIPAAPDLIPEGDWKKVPGGVCAAKGFKATGELLVTLHAPCHVAGLPGNLDSYHRQDAVFPTILTFQSAEIHC